MKRSRSQRGFTLVELIIIIALFAVVAGFSFPYFRSRNVQHILDSSSDELHGILRQAQGRAMSGHSSSAWGVHWGNGEYVLFAGDDYNARNTDLDLVIDYPNAINITTSVNVSGAPYPEDVVFEPLTGTTDADGTITVTASIGDTERFTVSPAGQIERQ